MSKPPLIDLIEKLAELFVLGDLTDSETRTDASKLFQRIADHSESCDQVTACARSAVTVIGQLNGDAPPAAAVQAIDASIRAMQEIVRDARDPDHVVLPDSVIEGGATVDDLTTKMQSAFDLSKPVEGALAAAPAAPTLGAIAGYEETAEDLEALIPDIQKQMK